MSEYLRTIRLTAPATEPVTLTEAKAHLLVDHTNDDAYITALISVARDAAEKYCNRYFADATAALLFDDLPATSDAPLRLPVPDVQSVDAVAYIDEDNATQAITGTTYDAEFQYLWPADAWPTANTQGVRVQVSVGAPVEIVAVKHAILIYITDLYEHRASTVLGVSVGTTRAAEMLLQPYRVEMGV